MAVGAKLVVCCIPDFAHYLSKYLPLVALIAMTRFSIVSSSMCFLESSAALFACFSITLKIYISLRVIFAPKRLFLKFLFCFVFLLSSGGAG